MNCAVVKEGEVYIGGLVDCGGRQWLLQRADVLRGLLAEESGGLRGLVPAEEGQLEGGGVQSCQTGQSQFIL